MAAARTITVEVAYALPNEQSVVKLDLPEGATIEQAIQLSGLLQRHPEIDLSRNKVGIFGQVQKLDRVLVDHDRVEIYRPIICDPKEVRRQRAKSGSRSES